MLKIKPLYIILPITLIIAVLLSIFVVTKVFKKDNSLDSGFNLSKSQMDELPDISYFKDHKSDQFIVDYDVITRGNPYKGSRAAEPHNGAHVHYGDDYKFWPKGGNEPENYPAIYSPFDGYISRLDYTFPTGENDQYAIDIAFAKSDGKLWSLHYSIEPYIKEPSKDFYKKFITVKLGDRIKKGQVIAYMYLVKDSQDGAHIHYHMNHEGDQITYPPAIFTKDVVEKYFAKMGKVLDGFAGQGDVIPPCMGYKLNANENPFGTGAVDELI